MFVAPIVPYVPIVAVVPPTFAVKEARNPQDVEVELAEAIESLSDLSSSTAYTSRYTRGRFIDMFV